MVLGLFDVYDYVFPEKAAYVGYIGICDEANLARETDESWTELTDDPSYNWLKLQPAIKVLNKVCPEAADWVRCMYKSDKLIWDNTKDGTYARYEGIKGTLFINQACIGRRHGEIAATLAHEHRHSRQNLTKALKVALFLGLTGERLDHLIENDAYLFEKEVYLAIFD